MTSATLIQAKWEELERDDPRFEYHFERHSFLLELHREAKSISAPELITQLEWECRLFDVASGSSIIDEKNDDAQWRTDKGIRFLRQRVHSPSPIVRATAARLLWHVNRQAERACGRIAAESYLVWFQRAAERTLNTSSSG
ncbi:MAG TPA: hypothetical protein VEU33_26360 [Archangium sp.]|nr:hypothetical protein [Archangium sp.]